MTALAQVGQCEVRGTWLHKSDMTDSKRTEVLSKIEKANLNTVFLISPGNRSWETDPNDFRAMLDALKDRELAVHVWLVNLYRTGGVDFRSSDEQKAQRQWAMDLLAKYPNLDGVHFDYIRYPGHWETGDDWPQIQQGKMEGITNTVRITFNSIRQLYPNKFLTAAVYTADNYLNSLIETIVQPGEYLPSWFVNWLANHPGNRYLTPRGTTAPVHMKVQQNPIGWLQEGVISGIMPMAYTQNDVRWQEDTDSWKSFLGGNLNQVFMGLGWEKNKSRDAAGLVRKIKYGRNQGVQGFVIFKLDDGDVDDTPLINALTVNSQVNNNDAPFRNKVVSCLSAASAPVLTPRQFLSNWGQSDGNGDYFSDQKINSLDYAILVSQLL